MSLHKLTGKEPLRVLYRLKYGSVTNFVSMVINSSCLVRIRYKSYREGAFYYGNSKGTITTDYQRKRLKSAGDVYALLKDSFKNLLQELLEAELDVSLGYDKMRNMALKRITNEMDILLKP